MKTITPSRQTNAYPGVLAEHSKPAILVVEDHPILSEFMASVASELGWGVSTAATVREFDEVLLKAQPDVVVIDLGLPDGDGLDVLRRLANIGYQGAIYIVSGFDEDILDRSCQLARTLGLNVIGRAQKPISAKLMQKMLVDFEREGT